MRVSTSPTPFTIPPKKTQIVSESERAMNFGHCLPVEISTYVQAGLGGGCDGWLG